MREMDEGEEKQSSRLGEKVITRTMAKRLDVVHKSLLLRGNTFFNSYFKTRNS
jgi:hypothetical protein